MPFVKLSENRLQISFVVCLLILFPSFASASGTLTYKGVDVMKWTKDDLTNQPSDAQINNIIQAINTALHPTHIAVSVPLDPNSDYPAFNMPSPRTAEQFTQAWSDGIHSHGIKIVWRGTWSGIEGLYGFTQLVGPNRFPAGTAATAVLDGNSTLLGKTYNYIVNHPSYFQDGDIWAPMPERTQGIFQDESSFLPGTGQGIQANYAAFYNDLKTVSDLAFAKIGKNVITGLTANNYSEVSSGWLYQSVFETAGMTVVDHYGVTHTPMEMDDNIRYIYARHGKPVFLQEWGDYWDADLSDADRTTYLNSMYTVFKNLENDGVLAGFAYWGAWMGNQEGILTDLGEGNYQINRRGLLLSALFGTPVTVPPPAPTSTPVSIPVINSFYSSSPSVPAGQPITLSWSVSGSPFDLSLDNGIGDVTDLSSKVLRPLVTTIYTLTANNSAGRVAQTVTVTVTPVTAPPVSPPTISSFSSSASSITAGESSTLSWSVLGNPTSLSLNNGLGDVTGLASKVVSPSTTTSYALTAANSGGSSIKTITIDVSSTTTPPNVILPLISNVNTSAITNSSALITWDTDVPTDAKIEFGTSGYNNSSQPNNNNKKNSGINRNIINNPDLNHAIRLENLSPGTQYRFQIDSKDNKGNAAFSVGGSFTTTGINTRADATKSKIQKDSTIILPANLLVGQTVKFKTGPTVYLVRADGLYPFDNFASFNEYTKDWGIVLKELNTNAAKFTLKNLPAKYILAQVSPRFGELGQVPGAVGSLPDGSLIEVGGITYVLSNQAKVPFSNLQIFLDLGYSIKNIIKLDITAYPTAKDYQLTGSEQLHPAGSWIVNKGTVYYVCNTGMVGVPDNEVFLNNGGRAEILLPANFADQIGISTRLEPTPMVAQDERVQK